MNDPSKIIILGIGNTLYSDEGIGVHCIPFLEEIYADRDDVEVVHGATDGMMLLGPVEDTDFLIIIDAINAGKEPGTVIRIEGEEVPKYFGIKLSIHQLGFQEVLAAAQLRDRYPRHIVMIGMQPYSLALSPDVTSEGQEKAKEIIKEVQKQVSIWSELLE